MLPSLSKCFCRITSYSKLPLAKYNVTPIVHLHTSSINNSFWEEDRKGGYKTAIIDKRPALVQIREGFKELRKEIGIWKNEVVEFLETDPLLINRPGKILLYLPRNSIKPAIPTKNSSLEKVIFINR